MTYKLRTRAAQAEKLDGRVRRFRLTDESVDRHGTIFRADGWDFSAFLRSPSIFWNHGSYSADETPIGKATGITRSVVDGLDGWDIDIEFAPEDVTPLGEKVLRGVDFGSIGMVSIGARPLEAEKLSARERADLGLPAYGERFLRQELVEASVVGVGSNRNSTKRSIETALREGRLTPDDALELSTLVDVEADEEEERSLRETVERNTRAIESLVQELSRKGGKPGGSVEPEAEGDPESSPGGATAETLRGVLRAASDIRETAERIRTSH